ncbi:hypothetical protein [Rhodothermus profundi]|nr:hypothetical protein [Rhodothermus profundi]
MRARILIWGKTYPELSKQHVETVCTAGCLDNGNPIRLYPIPYRYLPYNSRFRLYQWIEVDIKRNDKDPRPESYKVVSWDKLVCKEVISTENNWMERKNIIFRDTSWHYDCLRYLKQEQKKRKKSLGFIPVREILDIRLRTRPEQQRREFEEKYNALKNQTDLFNRYIKDLQFIEKRVYVQWKCLDPDCRGHWAGVLDWGLCELGRRKGYNKALQKMEELANLDKYELAFFVGNFARHPNNFGIVGLWYPRRSAKDELSGDHQLSLF